MNEKDIDRCLKMILRELPYIPGEKKKKTPPHLPPPETAVGDLNFQNHLQYQLGIRLHESGYYWEAHEAWESLWQIQDRNDSNREFLKALIQITAACLKRKCDGFSPALRLMNSAESILKKLFPSNQIRFGISLKHVLDEIEKWKIDSSQIALILIPRNRI